MDHVVYTDFKSNEMEKLLEQEKTMIIRGAAGRKMPYGRVNKGDVLYLINNNGEGVVKAVCKVKSVLNSEKMSQKESKGLVDKHSDQLSLSTSQYKKWVGKRYLTLIAVENVEEIENFELDKSDYGNMDDWLPVENIKSVKI